MATINLTDIIAARVNTDSATARHLRERGLDSPVTEQADWQEASAVFYARAIEARIGLVDLNTTRRHRRSHRLIPLA